MDKSTRCHPLINENCNCWFNKIIKWCYWKTISFGVYKIPLCFMVSWWQQMTFFLSYYLPNKAKEQLFIAIIATRSQEITGPNLFCGQSTKLNATRNG